MNTCPRCPGDLPAYVEHHDIWYRVVCPQCGVTAASATDEATAIVMWDKTTGGKQA